MSSPTAPLAPWADGVPPGVVILGMHRGGTTLAARLVAQWGAHPGGEPEQAFIPGDQWNPAGYWEERAVVEFNDRLLRRVEAGAFVPPAPEATLALAELARGSTFADEARALMEPRLAGRTDPWLLKDPRLSLLLPFWRGIWPRVLFVIPIRHPMSAARSLRARNYVPISAGVLLWLVTMQLVLDHTDGAPRIFVDYERTLHMPVRTCEGLWRVLQFYTGREGATAPAQAAAIVERGWSHFHDHLFDGDEGLYEPVRDLYHRLRALAAGSPDVPHAPVMPETTWRAARDYLQLWTTVQRLWRRLSKEERSAVIGAATSSDRELFGL